MSPPNVLELEAAKHAHALESVKHVLRSHGIQMDIDGCGCCGSPSVKVIYDGILIADEDEFRLKMIPK